MTTYRILGTLGLALLLASCGGGGGGGGDSGGGRNDQAPVISSFSASPVSVLPAQASTLSWNVANVEQVSIAPGIGSRPAQGSVNVNPLITTTYTLTASNSAGSRTGSVTVTVTPLPAAPTIDSFSADPAAINGGSSSQLQWTTSNATLVSINQGVGNQPADGSTTVNPAATTTYRLTATGLGGTTTAETTITVTPAPVIGSFGISPAAILKGESATLSWDTSQATQVRIDQGLGNRAVDGSSVVSPDVTTTYRLTATGPGGERSADTTLKVIVYDWSSLSSALDAIVGNASGQVDGYSFALEIAGRPVFTRGGGNLRANTTVPIASASKAPSAAAILALVDAGLLDLDTPISTYLGDTINWPAAKSAITLRMLLNHTSGLPFASACLENDSTTLQACAQEIADGPVNFIPGLFFNYSGAGYQLAGYVAQQAAGMPWATLFKQYIGDPLGLTTYRYVGDTNPRIGGGALSNTADYLKLTRMFLNGGMAGGTRVLSAASAASVRTDQIGTRPMVYKPVDASLDGYSNGWWISAASAHPDSAGPELSDPGLLGATPWMDVDRNYSAALWIIDSTQTGVNLWRSLRPLILEQINTQGLPE